MPGLINTSIRILYFFVCNTSHCKLGGMLVAVMHQKKNCCGLAWLKQIQMLLFNWQTMMRLLSSLKTPKICIYSPQFLSWTNRQPLSNFIRILWVKIVHALSKMLATIGQQWPICGPTTTWGKQWHHPCKSEIPILIPMEIWIRTQIVLMNQNNTHWMEW